MNHFLSLTCLSWLRSWYLTAPAVIAGMERDLPGGVDPAEEGPEVMTVPRGLGASYAWAGRQLKRRGERIIDLHPAQKAFLEGEPDEAADDD